MSHQLICFYYSDHHKFYKLAALMLASFQLCHAVLQHCSCFGSACELGLQLLLMLLSAASGLQK